MGRQNNNKNNNSSQSAGAELLNFHFSSGPPRQQQSNQNNGRRRNNHQHHRNNHNYNNNNNNNNKKRNQQDRAAVRRKPNSHMFNLHSSADHAFCITRKGLKQQQYSFSGSDEAVSWESVRMVKVFVSSSEANNKNTTVSSDSCPICLDSLVCARITKCGHVFCLACLLRHVQVHAQSNPYTHVKCPCCAVPLHTPDLRPVMLISSLPPKLHQRKTLIKLHRTKDCPSPYLPLPEQPKRSTSHAAPSMTDTDAPFCRFNYIETQTYQQHLQANKQELQGVLKNLTSTSAVHPALQYQNQVETIFVSSALDTVQKELQKALEEVDQEAEMAATFASSGSGVYQTQPPQLVASNYEFVTAPLPDRQQQQQQQRDSITDHSNNHLDDGSAVVEDATSSRHRSESVGSESAAADGAVARRYRGDSISSYASVETSQSHTTTHTDGSCADTAASSSAPMSPQHSKAKGKRNSRKKQQEFPKASMYLDSEGSTHFYQSEDGQLCFLSRFNMSCLLADFSAKLPENAADVDHETMNFWQRRCMLPLPDSVEGEILELEHIHLTPDMRKRMPFLLHLPLYTDITFVELDLNNLLSNDTKRKFKADFDKRRKRRQSKVKAEKREDKMAQKKEEERINELKARIQQIDPSDEFFMVSPPPEEPVELTGDAFGPAIAGGGSGGSRPAAPAAASVANSNPAFSFSNVCQSGGVALINAESNFPALGSPSTPTSKKQRQPPPPPTWGSPSRSAPAMTSTSSQQPPGGGRGPPLAQAGSSSPGGRTNNKPDIPVVSKQPPVPGGKKKKKGKKIVLFSSGGQRGTSY